MYRAIQKGAAVLAVLTVLWAGAAASEPLLDQKFGGGGLVVSDFGLGDDAAFDLVVQPDGKIVVAGYVDNGAVKNLAVARYLPDGSFDRDFNSTGLFTLSMSNGDTRAESLVLQPDGRIVVAAAVDDTDPGLGVIRLSSDGFLDATFADNGRLLYGTDGRVASSRVAIAADGTIIAAATLIAADDLAETDPASLLVKLDQQGSLALDFGERGVARVELAEPWAVRTVILPEDGTIYVGGELFKEGIASAGLVRLTADGSPDPGFAGGDGTLLLPVPGPSLLQAMVQDGDAGMLLTGYATVDGQPESFVARVSLDGELQSDFASAGVFLGSMSEANQANAIARDDSGTIVVAGTVTTAEGSDIFLLSLEGDSGSSQAEEGQPLEQFPLPNSEDVATGDQEETESSATISPMLTAAYQVVDIGTDEDFANAIAIAPDGSVVVAGASESDGNMDFALLRFTDQPTDAAAATAGTSSGVVAAGYRVTTLPVTSVDRVGAVSGGKIVSTSRLSCETACETTCADDLACLSSCKAICAENRVVLRGVVYATVPNPSYRGESSDDDGDDQSSVVVIDSGTGEESPEGGGLFPAGSASNYRVVRYGWTEDGSGDGEYGSDIQGITPNTTYYVRAYAVLGNGRVLYGNQLSFSTDDACFIATAAYGSILRNQVVTLRAFRDKFLLPSQPGRQLVGFYYRFSPAIAEAVADNALLRWGVRVALAPVILFATVALNTNQLVSLALLSTLLLLT
ncbi:MAG TPA: delta-60 repeat domain-containing protein, partial [Desulforhopalus sp.]|nr:delta-60 repeat domain-containing protein [Desulforhopalus sp.]